MPQDWELLGAKHAGALERRNVRRLHTRVTALIRSHLSDGKPPDEAVLLKLHGVATTDLLRRPGRYRSKSVPLRDKDGFAVHRGAPASRVPQQIRGFLRQLAADWKDADPVALAAFAIWRLNCIHPFPNGNGRTAAAFGYACLCIKFGRVLPGRRTVLHALIADSRPLYPYLAAAHSYYARTRKRPGLPGLRRLLQRLLRRQLTQR